ncbi:tRNA-specific adenosine deaminase [Gordonia sputi NBRC 100414]|uniref:tRNA-specific adenosine deaminase n=2 Tax=Gordoniaceae TaxID=85026 RepID=H5U5I4_9ACTN|nr:tRNA-specific adenosine deaminase [Gordonia sputi NBRC 100414]
MNGGHDASRVPDQMSLWDQMIGEALSAAVDSSGPDDVPIGAVVFDPAGVELARAGNRRELDADPTAHAEILALRAAAHAFGDGWRLPGCTIAVTVEPCTMCAGAITLSRVDALVFGAWEPKTGAVGSLWDVVRDPRLAHRPQVRGGVREAECRELMVGFFDTRREG